MENAPIKKITGKYGEYYVGIPFELLIEFGWSEGVEVVFEKGKDCLIVSLSQ